MLRRFEARAVTSQLVSSRSLKCSPGATSVCRHGCGAESRQEFDPMISASVTSCFSTRYGCSDQALLLVTLAVVVSLDGGPGIERLRELVGGEYRIARYPRLAGASVRVVPLLQLTRSLRNQSAALDPLRSSNSSPRLQPVLSCWRSSGRCWPAAVHAGYGRDVLGVGHSALRARPPGGSMDIEGRAAVGSQQSSGAIARREAYAR